MPEEKVNRHTVSVRNCQEWPHILKPLGEFDLDPCSPARRPWPTARQHFTIYDNGLMKPWAGRVWLNPPYGNETWKWVSRLADHGNGLALIFARTETATFFPWVWDYAHSILFLRGRVNFCDVSGKTSSNNAGAPSVLISYGAENTESLARSGLEGKLVRL
jgi:hypothetical protein